LGVTTVHGRQLFIICKTGYELVIFRFVDSAKKSVLIFGVAWVSLVRFEMTDTMSDAALTNKP